MDSSYAAQGKLATTLVKINVQPQGFPGGPVVKILPCNAGDTTSLIPGPEDPTCCKATKPVPQLLSLRSAALEPQLLSPHAATTEAHEP